MAISQQTWIIVLHVLKMYLWATYIGNESADDEENEIRL